MTIFNWNLSDNGCDSTIDLMDVEARIEELEAEEEASEDEGGLSPEDESELSELREFYSQAEGYGDRHSVLLDEDSAQASALDQAREAVGDNTGWPFDHIDFDAAAEELVNDWTCIELDGQVYYVN